MRVIIPPIPKLVVGISGVSCGGKTTISKLLNLAFPWATVLHQDKYFHPNEAKYHVYMEDLKHYNWELKSALDFPKMERDLARMLQNCKPYDKSRDHSVKEKGTSFLI